MATDLERFVEAPGRDEKIKEVREMIDRMGVEYLYLQFVSITGKVLFRPNVKRLLKYINLLNKTQCQKQ